VSFVSHRERMIEQLFATRTRNSIGRIVAPRQDLSFAQLKIYYEGIGRPLGAKFASNLELKAAEGAPEKSPTGPLTTQKSRLEITPQATPQVEALIKVLCRPLSISEILVALGKSDRRNVHIHYVWAAIDLGLVERTIPDRPKSPLQKYRLTPLGETARKELA